MEEFGFKFLWGEHFHWDGISSSPVLDWSDLQLFATLPTILIMFLLFIPSVFKESSRWLSVNAISDPRSEKCVLVETLDPENIPSSSGSLIDLFRNPGLQFGSAVLAYIWCVFLIIFMFVLMNCKDIIPGDLTINIEILSGMDLIAGFITFPLVLYVNRQLSTSLCFFMTGTSFLLHFFHPHPVYKQIFAQLGLFFNTLCFNLMSVSVHCGNISHSDQEHGNRIS